MWTKCRNCVCRLTIVLIIIISLCYYYFSPIAYRIKIMFFFYNFVYFISLENISFDYYCYYNNKGYNNKTITIIVIIIIINHHYKLFLYSYYCCYNYWQIIFLSRKRCEELLVRVGNKYCSPLKQHSIISHLSYQCYKNISIKYICFGKIRVCKYWM